ncbi:U-box domain-containing protein 26-like [Zingiber officinale]|uniref:U-box domain-containing protein 26-like n=1 Tax=Zingiber officinale TaxID=94328 RepID=UPI001C4B5285|nr:U-box domain-containing protein 26-like [Zingiber officinale]
MGLFRASSSPRRPAKLKREMPGSVAPLDVAGVTIPHHFRCPISLELMRDPVTVCTGQTYDRPSIESWVAIGNTTCPVSRVPLADFTLIPNHTLRRLIQDWCVAHRSHGVERIPTPKQPADPPLVRSLVASASSGSVASRVAALCRLRALARESEKNRAVISTHETRSALVEIAFEGEEELRLSDAADQPALEAMAVLSVLPLSDAESTAVASRPERLRRLGEMLREHPSMDARINAAAVIEAVAAGARSTEFRAAVGATEGVMEGLVALVEQRGNPRAVRVGIRGLFALCLAKENRFRAVAAGAAAAVVGRVGELPSSDAERALAAVELLCRWEGGREAVVEGWGGGAAAVASLVRAMAGKASGRAAEHAAGALVAVLGNSEALQMEAVAAGVVSHLLLLVQGGCSERAKRKAQLLLKLIRSALPLHDSVANSDDYLQPF